jgi:hypothetical protein
MVAVVLFIENTSSCYWLMCFDFCGILHISFGLMADPHTSTMDHRWTMLSNNLMFFCTSIYATGWSICWSLSIYWPLLTRPSIINDHRVLWNNETQIIIYHRKIIPMYISHGHFEVWPNERNWDYINKIDQ